jgi:hypothetical protein
MSTTNGETALTVKELEHHGATSHEVYRAGFYDNAWDYTVRSILGRAPRGGSEPGEVLAAIADVRPKDHRAWFSAWVSLGERVTAIAGASAAAGHRVSAARAYLRAANYLAVAVEAIDGLDDDTDQLLPTFRKHRAAWEGFVANVRWSVERVDIPYEGGSMPGWFFTPYGSQNCATETGGADRVTKRPTLVMNNGSDGSISGDWCEGAEGALERGYNVLLFDGPGQQSMLFERDIPFRHDWEKVLTPVADFLLAREDVDPARLTAYGVSQAGYWVTRALAFEHRFAAAILDGGVIDISRSWFANVPHMVLSDYLKGDKAKFDRDMAFGMRMPGGTAVRATWEFRARPYGVTGYSAVLDEVSKYVITPEIAGSITTPLYITDADGDQFFPGQSADLAALVPGSTLVRFTQAEGASYHCQPLGRELTEQRMFDWLDERIG